MGTISYTIPVAGSTAFSIAAPEVNSALQTLLTWANGNVDGSNVDPSLTGRRLIGEAYLQFVSTNLGNYFASTGGFAQQSGIVSGNTYAWWYLDPANYSVVGKANTQVVLRMSVSTNSVAPTVNFIGKIAAVTFAGGSSNMAITAGTILTSTAAVNAPAANSVFVAESAPIAFPAAGAYAPMVNVSAASAGGSVLGITLQLFVVNN